MNINALSSLAVLIVISFPCIHRVAHAASSIGSTNCNNIEDNRKRLACFDSAATKAPKRASMESANKDNGQIAIDFYQFMAATRSGLFVCRMKGQAISSDIDRMKRRRGTTADPAQALKELSDCIRSTKQEASSNFDIVAKHASVRPTAFNALKEYYVTWQAAIDSTDQVFNGANDYDQRQDEYESRLTELTARYDLEMK